MNETTDIVARLLKSSTDEDTMVVWDRIRGLLLDGCMGTMPRDIFENILDGIDEERQEAAAEIERLRKLVGAADASKNSLHLEGWLYDHRSNASMHEDDGANYWETTTRFSTTEPRSDFAPYSKIRAVYTLNAAPAADGEAKK